MRVKEAGLNSPVIIVIGETASYDFKMTASELAQEETAYRSNMSSYNTYGVIGTAQTMQEFSRAVQRALELRRKGNDREGTGEEKTETQKREKAKSIENVKIVPLIEMQVVKTSQVAELAAELEQVDAYDWIFFTSKQAVASFFETYEKMQLDIRALAQCKFGAIGQGTAKALLEHGIHADFIPQCAEAESFAREFVTNDRVDAASKLRILLPRAKQGNPILGEILQEAGIEAREIPVYDVVGTCYEHFSKAAQIRNFVFFSASGVRAFFEELGSHGETIPVGSKCYCIGQKTRAELEAAVTGQQFEILTADIPSVDGLAEKIVKSLAEK